MKNKYNIVLAQTAEHFNAGRQLVAEYIGALSFDVSFQNYEVDIAELHTMYNKPHGALWLVEEEGRYKGCSGVRKIDEQICELKRTYLQPELRGKGLGQLLLQYCMNVAREIGYQKMYLDTHLDMGPAIALYTKNGFKDIPPYYHNPIEETKYLGLEL